MKKILLLSILLFCGFYASAQFEVSNARSWDVIPPEAQKKGFGFNKGLLAQMDNDPEEEDVFLFTANSGHYPYFDLFRCYYAIVGHYSKKVKFVSDVFLSTSRDLIVEDRNIDGKSELYRKYIKDSKFTVDEKGNNLKAEWVYDTIEWKSPGT